MPLIDIFDGRSQLIAYFQMWHTGRLLMLGEISSASGHSGVRPDDIIGEP